MGCHFRYQQLKGRCQMKNAAPVDHITIRV